MREVLLVERMDGVGGGGERGTTGGERGAGVGLGGPRSMAAAILSRLAVMHPRGSSNIATRSRRSFVVCRISDSSCSSISNPVRWSCRNGWSSGLAMLPRRIEDLDSCNLFALLPPQLARAHCSARVHCCRGHYIVLIYCMAV